MDISRFELLLDFAEETRLHTLPYKISEVLGEKELEDDYTSTVFRDDEEKFGVKWNYESCGIIKEDVSDTEKYIKKLISTLELINNVAPIGIMAKRTLRIDWIFPSKEKEFDVLEKKYRQIFIREHELFSRCSDSSVVIDMEYEGVTLHHQSGAMRLSQLQEMFKVFTIREGHPPLFLFINNEVTDSHPIQYTKDDMDKFIEYSFQISKSHAENFGKIVGRLL